MDLYVDNIEDIFKIEIVYNFVCIDMYCSVLR